MLAACSSSGDPSQSPSASPSGSPSAEPSPSTTIVPSADLSGVNVTEQNGVPEVKVTPPWGIESTQTKVLKNGGEQKLTEKSTVTVKYVGVNGSSGQVFDSSYGNQGNAGGGPVTFSLDQMIPGFRKGLAGQSVGSRVLIGVAPADGYTQGTQNGGISPGDSLIFVVDIVSANFEKVTGQEVKPADGLPAVTVGDSGPEIKVAEGAKAPEKLVVQPLIKGPGIALADNSTFEAKYRAWTYPEGKLVVDAWVNQSGVLSNMIEGWKQGLKGQTNGSRVMLVVPGSLAYPNGNEGKKIAPGQNLVYVIDLLNVSPGK